MAAIRAIAAQTTDSACPPVIAVSAATLTAPGESVPRFGQGIASFKTARYLRLPQMIEHMTTILELKPERPRGAPCDDTGADGHKRAECEERIRELLSALEGGTCLRPGNTRNVPKAVIRETKTTPDSETSLRFLLTDRAGPIAEFGSWQDARKYMCDLQISGASIIRVEKKRSELETVP